MQFNFLFKNFLSFLLYLLFFPMALQDRALEPLVSISSSLPQLEHNSTFIKMHRKPPADSTPT